MAELQDHLRLTCLVDGKRQLELSKIDGKLVTKSQAIETLEGLVGKTPGSGQVTVNLSGAIPASGPEFDYWSAAAKGTYHTIQIPVGSKSYIGNGWFDDSDLTQSVNGPAEISATWIGTMAPLR
jgi:hypothetical protein